MEWLQRFGLACRAFRYAGAFIILSTIPLLYLLHPLAPLATLIVILSAILVGENLSSSTAKLESIGDPRIARLLPILYIPLQLAVVGWGIVIASRVGVRAGEILSIAIPIGVTVGIFGVLAAHEMVHSRKASEQRLGGLLLAGMCYRHFRIAHVYGHHRLAGTPGDPSTARRGESFYAFFLRTLCGQIVFSWRFEQRRCANRNQSFLHNRALHDFSITVLLSTSIVLVFGGAALGFFVLQCATAILILELFNFVAHYGLFRRKDAHGALEAFGPEHAWNMSAPLANFMLLNMGRHSDHHRRAAAPYETLQPLPRSPELPAGYAGSILLALVPPLWRHVMDKKLLMIHAPGIAAQAA